MTVENLTVMGIYEPWDFGNPTLPFNPIFSTWEVLEEEQRQVLMNNDHMYLGVTIDRGQLPTSSTADAADWLEDLGTRVQQGTTPMRALNCIIQTLFLGRFSSSTFSLV